jgi:heat shock protein HtpX
VGAYGLQTHIWSNNWRSALLMAGFPLLLVLVEYALFLLYAGFAGEGVKGADALSGMFIWAGDMLVQSWPFAIVGALLWFGVAYAFYQGIIDAATGAHPVERRDEPRLYNLLENLCISRGMKMPALRIMETDALNAFATGLHEGQYSITVTRGIMDALSDEEIEAVLGHELTHIRNCDVRLMVIAVVFVGIFSFVGQLAFRALWYSGGRIGGRRSRDRDSGGAGLIAVMAALALIAIAYGLAIVIRFALSRNREFLADAGSVELTKNPDAMISALQRISGHSNINAPSEVREMFLDNEAMGFDSLFATHPPIQRRIDALVKYAGGRVRAPDAAPAGPWSNPPKQPPQAAAPKRGPWG